MNNRILLKIIKEEISGVLKEADLGDGLTMAGDWPENDRNVARARGLAQRGQAEAEAGAPWIKQDSDMDDYPAPSGGSVTDEDVIRSIYNLLMTGASPGHRAIAPHFMELMKERGVISIEAGDKISKGHTVRSARKAGYSDDIPDVGADEMEASLGRLRDTLSRKK